MPVTAPVSPPDSSDPVKRGEYLATVGLCGDCHTPLDEKMQLIQELAFAGGRSLVGGWGELASHNITPDPSGIAHYDEDLFIKVLRTGNPGGRQLNPIMLWGYYRNMTDEDLKAIFAYLQSLKPVKHRVDNTEPPTYCKLCRQTHGFGDRN
jgi:mono/diheme cytochrome c family protein